MAGGEAGEAAPLLEGAAATERYREGCPGCRLAEANDAKTGVPCLSFLYIWVVCLVAGESPPPRRLTSSHDLPRVLFVSTLS